MHAIKKEPVTVYFGGSYRETWAADFTLSITYFDRKPVRAVPGENGTWTAQDGDAELCAKINSAPEDSLIHRYFYASAEVYNAVRVCFAARIPAASIHEFLSIENEPIAAAELMRVLMDDCGLSIERAYSTSVQSCGVYREGYSRELKDELMKLQPRTAHVFSIMYESAKNYVAVHFNSSKERFRNPAEAVTCGQRVTMSFDVLSGRVGSAELKLQDGNKEYSYPMTRAGDTFTVSFRAPENTGSMTYYMLLRSQGENLYICPDISGYNGIIYREKHPGFRFVVYRPEFATPSWFRKAVMYQVYPDRFARSDDDTAKRGLEYHRSLGQNPDWHEGWDEPVKYWARPGEASYSPDDFYGGTFKGIESRLDYLRELGITCLYLNPIVESRSNHRYDTSDYMKADPILGTNEDFEHLCSAAKDKGIRVILDGVFSHTGADSLYFNRYGNYPSQGACQGRHSPYYGWYSFQRFPDNYKSWWGFQDLPEVNELNPEWQDFVLSGNDSVVKTWLRRGASGWRIDVADELPDEALTILRRAVKAEDPEAPIIGEVWEDPTNKESYGTYRNYAFGYSLDSVMNYPFRTAVIDFLKGNSTAFALRNLLLSQKMNYPKPLYYSLMNLLGSHDMERIRSALAIDVNIKSMSRERQMKLSFKPENLEHAITLEKMGAALQFSVPGVPSVYYGDEQGMCGVNDPFNRMPFTESDCGLKECYKQLAEMRKNHPCMSEGEIVIKAPDVDTLVIARFIRDGKNVFGEPAENETVVVAVNRSKEAKTLSVNLSRQGCGIVEIPVEGENFTILPLEKA